MRAGRGDEAGLEVGDVVEVGRSLGLPFDPEREASLGAWCFGACPSKARLGRLASGRPSVMHPWDLECVDARHDHGGDPPPHVGVAFSDRPITLLEPARPE